MATPTPKLNVDTSVVDYLKSTGKDSSFNSRASLFGEGYTGSGEQNATLLAKLKGGVGGSPAPQGGTQGAETPTSPLGVTDPNASAMSYINGNQKQDFDLATGVENDVPVRGSTKTYQDAFAELQKTLGAGVPAKPETTSFEKSYTSELEKAGVSDLEQSLADLTASEQEIRAQFRVNKAGEKAKPVAMNVIEGRVSEQERDANERLDTVLRQKDYITNQLKTKYDVVNNLMNLKKMDYESATEAYNTAFTQNLNMFNTVKGIVDADKSETERKEDNARANAQIIYNNITSGGLTFDSISPDQKLAITKLEMQAGLPSGFFQTLQSKNPKADIVTSTTRTSGGQKYADIIMRDSATGALVTKSILLGSTNEGSGGGDLSDGERKNAAFSDVNKILDNPKAKTSNGDPVKDANGFITPAGFKQIVKYGATQGLSKSDIISQYGSDLYADEDYAGYGLTSKEKDLLL